MGDIIKAARERVPGFYKLSISQGNDASARETVKNNVEWLHFSVPINSTIMVGLI